MSIMLEKDLKRNSELNSRISADLRERAQRTQRDIDGVEDSAYVKDTKKTGKFTWVWIVLVVLAIISLACIIFI